MAVAFTFVLWCVSQLTRLRSYIIDYSRPARLSIIFSIIRLANRTVQRQIAYIIAASFGCMWSALLAHKLTLCSFNRCHMTKAFALSQLISQYFLVLSVTTI